MSHAGQTPTTEAIPGTRRTAWGSSSSGSDQPPKKKPVSEPSQESAALGRSPLRLSLASFGSTTPSLVVISSLAVTFSSQSPRKGGLSGPLRVAASVSSCPGKALRSYKDRPRPENGLVRATWAALGWELAVPSVGGRLQVELQAPGLLRSTSLASASIDLTKFPLDIPLFHCVEFGVGTLTAHLLLRGAPNPLVGIMPRNRDSPPSPKTLAAA